MSGDPPDIMADLEFLEHHWGSAYLVGREGGQLIADRRDGKGIRLAAPDCDGLHGKIRADYVADPVPRDLAVSGGPRRGMSGTGEDGALDALTVAWGDQYDEFWVDGGEWGAHRAGAGEDDVLTAASPDELDRAIRAREAGR